MFASKKHVFFAKSVLYTLLPKQSGIYLCSRCLFGSGKKSAASLALAKKERFDTSLEHHASINKYCSFSCTFWSTNAYLFRR